MRKALSRGLSVLLSQHNGGVKTTKALRVESSGATPGPSSCGVSSAEQTFLPNCAPTCSSVQWEQVATLLRACGRAEGSAWNLPGQCWSTKQARIRCPERALQTHTFLCHDLCPVTTKHWMVNGPFSSFHRGSDKALTLLHPSGWST